MKRLVYYLQRDLTRWLRRKIAVISALITPAAWLIFVGLTLPTTFTDNYLDFITPGILVMSMLGTSLQGGSLLMFDKILGFLNKFLALPAPRETILFGKILFITIRGLIQTTVILILAFLLGASMYDPLTLMATYIILFLFGVLFSSLSTTLALQLDDHDSYAAVNAMVSMPLFFTSTALMPYNVMPAWLRVIAHLNPVSYAIDAIRMLGTDIIPWANLLGLAVAAVIVLLICIRRFRRVTV